jgi:putative FmdB family regulatory protein
MPTYEYKCSKCSHLFEDLQKISDPPLKKCPKCGAPVERIISGGSGLIFKGSGFYITDYKKSGEKKEPASEPVKKESKDKPDSKPKPSSESTPSKNKPAD